MNEQIKAVMSGIKNGRTPQIRKIEFSRDLLWGVIRCVGKYECEAGRQKWIGYSEQEVIGSGVNLGGFSLNTN